MAIGFPRITCFGLGGGHRARGDVGDRCRDVDDVDVRAAEKRRVIRLGLDGEGTRELLALRGIGPRHGDELGPGIAGEGSGQAVARVPVAEAEDADPELSGGHLAHSLLECGAPRLWS
jgi:hypothetical protein